MTKIFHPNVSSSGEICVNVLKRDWKPDLGLRHVLTVIRCLLIEPNAESGGWEHSSNAVPLAVGVQLNRMQLRLRGIKNQTASLLRQERNATPTAPTPAPAALNEEAGKLLLEGFEDFAKKARLMTSIHAKKPSVLTAAGGANAVNADGTAASDCKPGSAASGSAGAGAGSAAAAKSSKAIASKLAEKKKSLKRL
jgi:ubiquitin-conjugating enzyme E2 S